MSKRKQINAASFMAVAMGSQSTEVTRKLYRGIGAVEVIAVNPTRAQWNEIFKTSGGDEISYCSETSAKDKDGNDVKVIQTRVCLVTKTDPKIACNNGIETIIPVNIFVKKAYSFSNKEGIVKVQVIDSYGRTGWVTNEERKADAIPEYTIRRGERAGEKMKANLSKGYHPCFQGEEDLVKNIIAYINIDRPDVWDENLRTYVMKTDPKELQYSECNIGYLMEDLFKNKVEELRKIFKFQPNNRYKLCFGIHTTNKGAQYQCAYTRFPMKLNVNNYNSLAEELEKDRQAGRHPSDAYFVGNLEEVKLGMTNYESQAEQPKDEEPDPFAGNTQSVVDDLPPDDMPMDVDPFLG